MTEAEVYYSPALSLRSALRTNVSGTGGPNDYFSTVLALLMIHDFELSATKKKAILIWELFFRDNYLKPPSAAPCLMISDSDRAKLTIIDKNIESDGGVPKATVEAIRGRIVAISASYESAAGLGKWARFASSGSRKIGVVDPGFAGLFAPIKEYLVKPRMLKDIGAIDAGAELAAAKMVQKCHPTLVGVVTAAGFSVYDVGLS
jgi:hypothetical protein